MLTGEQIRTARKKAGMSQGELAKAVGVSLRAVGSWEREENSPNLAEVRLREVLGPHLAAGGSQGPGLEDASDAQLLAEIARRFARTDPQEKKAGEEHDDRSAPITDVPSFGIEGPEPPHLSLAADNPGTESEGSKRRRQQDEDAES